MVQRAGVMLAMGESLWRPRNRMRETITSGSVGRAPGNRCLYPEADGPPRRLLSASSASSWVGRRSPAAFGACGREETNYKQRNSYPSADTLFLTSGVGVSDSHGMDIIFTQHARARMADPHRGVVTEEEVRSVLASNQP